MDKLVRTKKGSRPFQIDFASVEIKELCKEEGIKQFHRSVQGALYFLPNSTKLISDNELLYIRKYYKEESKLLSVIKDVELKKKEEAKVKEEPSQLTESKDEILLEEKERKNLKDKVKGKDKSK